MATDPRTPATSSVSRRTLLRSAAALGAAGTLGALLAACGSSAPAPSTAEATRPAAPTVATTAAATALPATATGAPTVGASSTPAVSGSASVADRLRAEGSVNLYWPAGANFQKWIADTLIPTFKSSIRTAYGVDLTVNILPTGGGDAAFYQKLRAYEEATPGKSGFDIDVTRSAPSPDLIAAAQKGWFLPFSDFASLMPSLTTLNAGGVQTFTFSNKLLAAPLYQPTMAFFYNAEKVPNPPKNLAELKAWAGANPGKMTYEDPRSSSGVSSGSLFLITVMKALGKVDDPATWGPGWDYLKEVQGKTVPQPSAGEQALELMKRGEVWVMPFWNDWGLSARQDLAIPFMRNIFPDEGTPVRNTPLAVPRSAAHPTAALLFVNFALSDTMQRDLALTMRQIPASTAPGVWDGLPQDTFGFAYDYIKAHTFPAFTSEANIKNIQQMVQEFGPKVLGK